MLHAIFELNDAKIEKVLQREKENNNNKWMPKWLAKTRVNRSQRGKKREREVTRFMLMLMPKPRPDVHLAHECLMCIHCIALWRNIFIVTQMSISSHSSESKIVANDNLLAQPKNQISIMCALVYDDTLYGAIYLYQYVLWYVFILRSAVVQNTKIQYLFLFFFFFFFRLFVCLLLND